MVLAAFSRSMLRSRVANSDWCASRKVVSVIATGRWARRRRLNSTGPNSRSACRLPSIGARSLVSGSFSLGSALAGASP